MSFYVKRRHADGRVGWVGPIRSYRQARREYAAWEAEGWDAIIHDSTPEIRAEIRAWEKERRLAAK